MASRVSVLPIIGCLCALATAGCQKKAPPGRSTDVRIGVVTSLTGPRARTGEAQKRGYDIALEEINANGGVLGRRIELLYEDDADKPTSAASAVEKLVSRDVAAILGAYSSSCTLTASATANRRHTPFICPSGADDMITRRGLTWVFRINAPASEYAKAAFDFLKDVSKPKKVAVVFENTSFGSSTARAAKDACQSEKIEVVCYDSYEKGAQDLRPILTRIKARQPEVLFAVSYLADAILLTRQARELNLKVKAIVGGGAGFTMPQYAESLGADAEGVITVSQWSSSVRWHGAGEFSQKYKARYGSGPEYHSAETYAALHVLADAMKRAGSVDKDKIRSALMRTDTQTVLGTVKFENYDGYLQQNRHQMLVLQIQGGRMVTVWPKDLAEKQPIYPASQ